MPLLSTLVAPLGMIWDTKTRLLFVHIPKNAGTSIELAMNTAMEQRDGPAYHARTRDDRDVICPECIPTARQIRDGKQDYVKYMCSVALGSTGMAFLGNHGHNSEFVAHTTLRRCRNYTGGIRSFAVVRNPLDRLISGYNWALANGELNHSTFMEFADKSRMHLFKRPQSEFITACTTVFAYERMDDVWDFLISHYPNMKRGEKVNTAKRSTFKPHPDAVAKIMTEYRDDWELWLNAVARSNSKQWWRDPPCGVPKTLTEGGINTAVDAAWRTLAHGQKDEMFRGERPTGPPPRAVPKPGGPALSTGPAHWALNARASGTINGRGAPRTGPAQAPVRGLPSGTGAAPHTGPTHAPARALEGGTDPNLRWPRGSTKGPGL